MNGNSTEENSPRKPTTRAPGGSDAATRPTNEDTLAPMATVAASTAFIRANADRPRSTQASNSGAWIAPACHSSVTCCTSSRAARGGRPMLGVFR